MQCTCSVLPSPVQRAESAKIETSRKWWAHTLIDNNSFIDGVSLNWNLGKDLHILKILRADIFPLLWWEGEKKSPSWPEFLLVGEVCLPSEEWAAPSLSIILPGTYVIVDPCTIWVAGSTHGCLSKGWERWNEKQACQFKNSTFSPPTLLLRPGVDEGQMRELLLPRLLVCRWGGWAVKPGRRTKAMNSSIQLWVLGCSSSSWLQ